MLILVLFLLRPVLCFQCPSNEDHCFTSLDIDYGFTMVSYATNNAVYARDGRLYDIESNEEVPMESVISADGWNGTKHLITANGSMPGPEIITYQNQTITVIVRNHLLNEAVTIHWHGIDQLGSPAMDGTAFVSQCPIMPGQQFTYTFTPRFGGSYWYHSHVGNQRDNGLYGAFIVLRKDDPIPLSQQNIMLLQEYNHLHSAETLLRGPVTDVTHAVLINGRGSFQGINAPLETFDLRRSANKSLIHLFRIISAAGEETLLLEIPGLKLKITETDGWQIDPVEVDKIIINPAERYDFEIDLDCIEEKTYNVTVRILNGKTLNITDDVVGVASIKVIGDTPPPSSSCNSKYIHTHKVLNCPFEMYPYHLNYQCIPISALKSKSDNIIKNRSKMFQINGISKTEESERHFLNFAFTKGPTINGRKFIWPTMSALSQPSEVDTDCSKCTEEDSCRCSHSINLNSGSEIIMVLSNLGKYSKSHHPIHMHGHTFEILKMEFPKIEKDGSFKPSNHINCSNTLPNNESSCNSAFWADPSWNDYKNIPDINIDNPPRKDTIIVPLGGYVIIRIEATNPGVWFLHCHLDRHMVAGMALMLNESFSSYNGQEGKYIPPGLPTCHSFPQKKSGHDPVSISTLWTTTVIVLLIALTVVTVACISLAVALMCVVSSKKNKDKTAPRYKSTDDVETQLISS